MRSQPYKVGLDERLKDPDYAAAYISAAKKESNEVFMLALRDVAEAHKIGKVAAAAGVNRETLYRTLSQRGNPTGKTLTKILKVLGIEELYVARPPKRAQKNAPTSGRMILRVGIVQSQKLNQSSIREIPPAIIQQSGGAAIASYFPLATAGTIRSLLPVGYANQNEILPDDYVCSELLGRSNGSGQENFGTNPISVANRI
jgi:probable addiction module antidote protein